ncbi:MAG: hypothetical protein WAM14_26955 [Candidatus Nitrosopolaris sp.]
MNTFGTPPGLVRPNLPKIVLEITLAHEGWGDIQKMRLLRDRTSTTILSLSHHLKMRTPMQVIEIQLAK